MPVVEVVVRFAGTLLAVERVQPHERFVIGTARDVDLAVPGLTAFPLVDRGRVRVPIGIAAHACEHHTELDFGLLVITCTQVTDAPPPVPRPRASRRIVPYLASALVLHLALVTVAMATAQPEQDITIPVVHAKPPPRSLPKKLPERKPRPKPKQAAKAAQQAAAASEPPPAPTTADEARAYGRQAGIAGAASLDDLSMITGSKDLAKELADVGPLYDPDAAAASQFGGSAGAFNPERDPKFDSVKTGRYATTGNAGANYRLPARGKFREVERPPIMGLTCDDGQCKTDGTLDRFTVRDYVEKRYVDMVKCFERHAKRERSIELVLHFDIGADGRPNEVHANARTGFGQCLVRLVERTQFPSAKPTRVTYPVAFWRT